MKPETLGEIYNMPQAKGGEIRVTANDLPLQWQRSIWLIVQKTARVMWPEGEKAREILAL